MVLGGGGGGKFGGAVAGPEALPITTAFLARNVTLKTMLKRARIIADFQFGRGSGRALFGDERAGR